LKQKIEICWNILLINFDTSQSPQLN
jgi:hypothetical protein